MISAIIGGIAASLAVYAWLARSPVALSVVGVEPSFSPGYKQVTLWVRLHASRDGRSEILGVNYHFLQPLWSCLVFDWSKASTG